MRSCRSARSWASSSWCWCCRSAARAARRAAASVGFAGQAGEGAEAGQFVGQLAHLGALLAQSLGAQPLGLLKGGAVLLVELLDGAFLAVEQLGEPQVGEGAVLPLRPVRSRFGLDGLGPDEVDGLGPGPF